MDVIGLESCFQPLGSNLSESGALAGLVQGRIHVWQLQFESRVANDFLVTGWSSR